MEKYPNYSLKQEDCQDVYGVIKLFKDNTVIYQKFNTKYFEKVTELENEYGLELLWSEFYTRSASYPNLYFYYVSYHIYYYKDNYRIEIEIHQEVQLW